MNEKDIMDIMTSILGDLEESQNDILELKDRIKISEKNLKEIMNKLHALETIKVRLEDALKEEVNNYKTLKEEAERKKLIPDFIILEDLSQELERFFKKEKEKIERQTTKKNVNNKIKEIENELQQLMNKKQKEGFLEGVDAERRKELEIQLNTLKNVKL